MDPLSGLILGFQVALTPERLMFAFLGALVGTLVGALPGIGPVTAIAILVPVAFNLDATDAMIMMAGIYYGSMYGGSITSVLLNVPGESASVMTCLDGHQLARQGRAGAALGIAAIGSFIAGTLSVIGLMFLAPVMVKVALGFGPPEYFAVMVFGLVTLASLGGSSLRKALIMAAIGLLLGTVGIDPIVGMTRFTFGQSCLWDGLGFLPVTMGHFAVAEVLLSAEEIYKYQAVRVRLRLAELLPTWADLVASKGAILRGTVIGFIVGVLPGAGATIASFLAYAAEKRLSKTPERFGRGAIEGVAAPESANNAAVAGAFVPLLSLGVPGSGATAVMLGVILMFGLRPGPLLFETNPDFVWGLIASMYIGNLMLLVMNLPGVPIFASLMRIPYPLLMPAIIAFSLVGTFALNNNMADVLTMLVFGLVGYLLRKADYPPATLVLALVLGPMVEKALRQSLVMSQGDFSIFLTRPIAAGFVAVTVLSVLLPLVVGVFNRRLQARPVAALSADDSRD